MTNKVAEPTVQMRRMTRVRDGQTETHRKRERMRKKRRKKE